MEDRPWMRGDQAYKDGRHWIHCTLKDDLASYVRSLRYLITQIIWELRQYGVCGRV